jgi:hypothetical protein
MSLESMTEATPLSMISHLTLSELSNRCVQTARQQVLAIALNGGRLPPQLLVEFDDLHFGNRSALGGFDQACLLHFEQLGLRVLQVLVENLQRDDAIGRSGLSDGPTRTSQRLC